MSPTEATAEKAEKKKFYKVRCAKCGADSYWSVSHKWICKKCGSEKGLIVNLGREALRRRRGTSE